MERCEGYRIYHLETPSKQIYSDVFHCHQTERKGEQIRGNVLNFLNMLEKCESNCGTILD